MPAELLQYIRVQSIALVPCNHRTAQCRHDPTPKHSTANGQNGHTPGKCRGICKVGNTVVEQELIYEKLPGDIAERHVLLMDPILATGNSAGRAIQVGCKTWLLLLV